MKDELSLLKDNNGDKWIKSETPDKKIIIPFENGRDG